MKMKQNCMDTNRSCAWSELYRELLLPALPVSTVYVVGHQNPDSDAVGAAISYAMLLQHAGIDAKAVLPGPVNSETKYALERFHLKEPAVLGSADGLPVVLVDHSSISQSVSDLERARIIGIIDHHGIGDASVSEPVFIRCARTGAASTLVWLCWTESGFTIPAAAASAMLTGILSDTRNLTRNVTEADRKAVRALMTAAGMTRMECQELYEGMRRALENYAGMTDSEIFRTDYKEYYAGGVHFGIGVVRASGDATSRKMAARMKQFIQNSPADCSAEMLFLLVSNTVPGETAMILSGSNDEAEEVLETAFGHGTGEWIELKVNLSRKSTVVPKLSEVLEKKAAEKATTKAAEAVLKDLGKLD